MMKKTGAFLISAMVLVAVFAASAEAEQFQLGHTYGRHTGGDFNMSQYAGSDDGYEDESAGFAISKSQAAEIAKQSWPGSRVLRVQLLPSGVYAVTLKQGGEVSRVLVDAMSGELV